MLQGAEGRIWEIGAGPAGFSSKHLNGMFQIFFFSLLLPFLFFLKVARRELSQNSAAPWQEPPSLSAPQRLPAQLKGHEGEAAAGAVLLLTAKSQLFSLKGFSGSAGVQWLHIWICG